MAVDRPPEGAPRLVVLYSTCTLNKDYLSPYGPPGGSRAIAYTPNLQEAAANETAEIKNRLRSGLITLRCVRTT